MRLQVIWLFEPTPRDRAKRVAPVGIVPGATANPHSPQCTKMLIERPKPIFYGYGCSE